jgi:hypothetical protein
MKKENKEKKKRGEKREKKEKPAIFVNEFQSTLRFMVDFRNVIASSKKFVI